MLLDVTYFVFGYFTLVNILTNFTYSLTQHFMLQDVACLLTYLPGSYFSNMSLTLRYMAFLSDRVSSSNRNWSKLMDPIHKQNWRARCLSVWNMMDRKGFDHHEDGDDLGIYEIIKSHHGLVIVWCIIPSSGLEIRILFNGDQWQHIYRCQQHQHQYLQHHAHSQRGSISASTHSTMISFTGSNGFESTEFGRASMDDSDEVDVHKSVPITRADDGYNIGAKSFRYKNKREIFKKGLHSEVVRKWEAWNPRSVMIHFRDRDRILLDDSLEQLLVSYLLVY